MEQRIELNSKNVLKIQRMSFSHATKLLRIILKEAQKAGIKFDDSMLSSGNILNKDLSELMKGEKGILDTMVNSLINAVTSVDLEKMIFECAERSTWNDEKINTSLFDENEEAISDYFEICFHIVKEHLRPFFKNLGTLSGLIQKVKRTSKSQKQK